MAARQPLELIILVRIQAPQPEFPACTAGLFFWEWASRRSAGSAGSFYFILTSFLLGKLDL